MVGFRTLSNKITITNMKKAIRYCKKNGLSSTYYALRERMEQGSVVYTYEPPSQEMLMEQSHTTFAYEPLMSILVPTYETNPIYLREMIESVLEQSYHKLELILVDASESNLVHDVVVTYDDARIQYHRICKNQGIAENTNVAIDRAQGEYCSLLDHDDLLTKDALYHTVRVINEGLKAGNEVKLIYSDEDKMKEDGTSYFDPYKKLDFNLDLFLSNNYICHFTTIQSTIMKALRFRGEYNGAQDYDLFLRVVNYVVRDNSSYQAIMHIPKVLYHWRCHQGSTAENPNSKRYAYEAGKRAVEDFLKVRGWEVDVSHTKNLGFYRVNYGKDIFKIRNDIAAIGTFLYEKNRVVGGAYNEVEDILYKALPRYYSGYMNMGSLQQEVYALDIRRIQVREEVQEVYEEILQSFGLEQKNINEAEKSKVQQASIEFAAAMRKQGRILLLDPMHGYED